MSPGRVFAVPPRGRPPEGPGPERRLAELGLELPALRPRAGLYEGWVSAGDLLFLSGQGADGWVGRLGADLTVEQGQKAARDCALNLLAQQVEDAVRASGSAEVPSNEVGLAILGPLRDLDEVAYLRFGSVYRSFSSADDFEREIEDMRARRAAATAD